MSVERYAIVIGIGSMQVQVERVREWRHHREARDDQLYTVVGRWTLWIEKAIFL